MTFIPSGPVFAVHLTSSGFGWAVFDAPDTLVDWGIASAKQGRKRRLLHRFERLIKRHAPAVLVIEEVRADAECAQRIERLRRDFARGASGSGAATVEYDREAVHDTLGLAAGTSRYAVAVAVAERLDDLSHRMPRKSTAGRSPDARLSLFAAAALALTWYARCGAALPPAHSGAPE